MPENETLNGACPDCGRPGPGVASAIGVGGLCPTCGQPLLTAPEAPVAYGEWGQGDARRFRLLLAAPLVMLLLTAVVGYWEIMPLVLLFGLGGLALTLVSAIQCGSWLARRLAKGEAQLFILRMLLPLALLACYVMAIAVIFRTGSNVFNY